MVHYTNFQAHSSTTTHNLQPHKTSTQDECFWCHIHGFCVVWRNVGDIRGGEWCWQWHKWWHKQQWQEQWQWWGERGGHVFWAAREIMNQTTKKLGTAAMEDRRFRSFFGARKEIIEMVWNRLREGSLCPEKSKPKHLLWALYFLKVYPREGPGCSAVGGLKGAIDPKTVHKWVWLFLKRITKLADIVVSFYA